MRRPSTAKAKAPKTVTIVKVTLKKTEQDGKFTLRTFGKEIEKPISITKRDRFKERLGRDGFMLKEDFENGEFKEYGIDETRVNGFTLADQQAKELAAKDALIAELQSRLESTEKGSDEEEEGGSEVDSEGDKERKPRGRKPKEEVPPTE